MKRSVGYSAALALGAALLAPPAAAQLNSIPVYFSPKGGTGFTLAADFGKGVNEGENTAFAGRATLGISMLSIGAGVGVVRVRSAVPAGARNSEVQYMGNLALRLVGGALLPIAISLQGGVGYLKQDTFVGAGMPAERKTLNVPIGLGLGINVPAPAFSFEPWVAPRLSISRTEVGTASQTRAGFGVSGGFNLAFLMGLGLHVGFDWERLPSKTLGSLNLAEVKPATFGVGLHYTFRLPGLPGVPVVPGV